MGLGLGSGLQTGQGAPARGVWAPGAWPCLGKVRAVRGPVGPRAPRPGLLPRACAHSRGPHPRKVPGAWAPCVPAGLVPGPAHGTVRKKCFPGSDTLRHLPGAGDVRSVSSGFCRDSWTDLRRVFLKSNVSRDGKYVLGVLFSRVRSVPSSSYLLVVRPFLLRGSAFLLVLMFETGKVRFL